MARNRQFVVFHDDVRDRQVREPRVQLLPVRPVVVRHVHAVLRPGVQQPFPIRVFADGVHVGVVPDPVHDLRPRRPVVVRFPDVGGEVVQERLAHGDVGPPRVERRGVDLAHAAEVRHVRRRHIRPPRAAVPRHVYEAVVRPRPDHVDVHLPRPDRKDGGVDLRPIHVPGDRPAGMAERHRVGAREVAADRLPVVPPVRRLPQPVRGRVEDVRVERREDDGERPLPALHHLARRLARVEPRVGVHLARGAEAPVEAVDVAPVVRSREEDVEVLGVRRDVARLPASGTVRDLHGTLRDARRLTAERRRLAEAEPVRVPGRRETQRAVVLLRAADMEGHMGRGHAVIELRGRELLVRPVLPRVEADRAAAVVGHDEVGGVLRADPEVVEVAVRPVVDDLVRLAAVGRVEERGVLHVHDIGVVVVGEHVRVVEGALPNAALVVDQFPRRAAVVAPEEASVRVLEQGEDAPGVRARDGEADPPHDPLRRHAGVPRDLRPRVAPVGALEHPAPGTARGHRVLLSEGLPERRVDDVRVIAVEGDIHSPRALVAEEDALPGVAPIRAPEQAALLARRAVFPERRDIDDVRVRGMDADLGDAVRLGESDVLPRLAGVAAPVDAVPRHDVAADARLAGPDEDEVRIRLRDGDRPDRGRGDLEVGDREPVFSAVRRLPQSPAGGAEVALQRPPHDAARRNGAPSPVGTEVAPAVSRQERGIQRDRPGGDFLRGQRRGPGGIRQRCEECEEGERQQQREETRDAVHGEAPYLIVDDG